MEYVPLALGPASNVDPVTFAPLQVPPGALGSSKEVRSMGGSVKKIEASMGLAGVPGTSVTEVEAWFTQVPLKV